MKLFNQNIIKVASSQIGIAEIVGEKHNPKVLEYYVESGHSWVNDDETPWCSAFVGAMLNRIGIKGTNKLNARSYEDWGKDVTQNPEVGDIVVLWRQNRTCGKGHVGFYMNHDDKYVYMLGGNQGNKVGVNPYPIKRILSIRTK